eukprot:7338893-Prymnesium_polylepis.1
MASSSSSTAAAVPDENGRLPPADVEELLRRIPQALRGQTLLAMPREILECEPAASPMGAPRYPKLVMSDKVRWLEGLADSRTPLRDLAMRLPHGLKGKTLLEA